MHVVCWLAPGMGPHRIWVNIFFNRTIQGIFPSVQRIRVTLGCGMTGDLENYGNEFKVN